MQATRQQLSVQLSVILAAVCVVFLLIGGAAEADEVPGPVIEHVVSTGDTLWSIASEHVGPGEDVRPLIDRIRELSGLDTSVIVPGQILSVPAN